MSVKCFLILCLVAGSHQLSITEFVVPHSVEADSNAELYCHYSLDDAASEKSIFVKWWWTPSNGEDRKQLYQRTAGYDPVIMQHKILTDMKANDTIVLLAVQPNASGIFECEVSNLEEMRRKQELIVYTKGTGPQLNVTAVPDGPDDDDEEEILITCEVENVAPLPDLKLSINRVENDMKLVITGPDENSLYSVSGNVTLNKNSVDGSEILCELFYVNPNVTHPVFAATLLYDPSGALTSTVTPEDTTVLAATIESHLPDDGIQLRGSFEIPLTISVLTYLYGLWQRVLI